MKTYEKIETIYERDLNGTKKLIEGSFRNQTVEFLSKNTWFWTEKIDGTNIRIYWDGHKVHFGGRTERASIPAHLINRLNELFGTTVAEEIFEQKFGEKEVILFGEGYGNKIQKVGADYLPDSVDFILFDVMVGDIYLARQDVEEIAISFGIKVVPVVGIGCLDAAVNFIKAHPQSTLGKCEMEGIVCRPIMELRDRCGKRVIVKIKWNDIKEII